jgi:hypothetical protein
MMSPDEVKKTQTSNSALKDQLIELVANFDETKPVKKEEPRS